MGSVYLKDRLNEYSPGCTWKRWETMSGSSKHCWSSPLVRVWQMLPPMISPLSRQEPVRPVARRAGAGEETATAGAIITQRPGRARYLGARACTRAMPRLPPAPRCRPGGGTPWAPASWYTVTSRGRHGAACGRGAVGRRSQAAGRCCTPRQADADETRATWAAQPSRGRNSDQWDTSSRFVRVPRAAERQTRLAAPTEFGLVSSRVS